MGLVPYTILIIHYIIQLKGPKIADKMPEYWLKNSFWKGNVVKKACCPIPYGLLVGQWQQRYKRVKGANRY
jgi:hypothetical protein